LGSYLTAGLTSSTTKVQTLALIMVRLSIAIGGGRLTLVGIIYYEHRVPTHMQY